MDGTKRGMGELVRALRVVHLGVDVVLVKVSQTVEELHVCKHLLGRTPVVVDLCTCVCVCARAYVREVVEDDE
jgi:hypothetical protein